MNKYDKIKKLIVKHTAKNTASKENAKAWLVKLGTHTADGKLKKEYGGE